MYFFWAIKESLKPCISYSVKYKGLEYYVKSSLSGYGYWDLINTKTRKIDYYRVSQSELKPIIKRFKIWFSVFKNSYKFQKSSWYRIDINKNLFSRISYINSDNIKF